MTYLKWQEQVISDFSEDNINAMYNRGFVFTRPKEGLMQQTRSIRIDLSKFELSSENKRILKKTENLELVPYYLPFANYTWEIGKMAKDFYTEKFGDGTFSANKVKELFTGGRKDFNRLLVFILSSRGVEDDVAIPVDAKPKYGIATLPSVARNDSEKIGYCIAVETNEMIHYSYPFYILDSKFQIPNIGMGMMLQAIIYAKENNKKYIYLGSFQRPTDVYKLQFKGLEWFDGESWSDDTTIIKSLI